MNIVKYYTTAVVACVLSIVCLAGPASAQQVRGNGNVQTQDRNVSGYKGLQVSGGFSVELTKGNTESVRIEAEENLMEHIKTEVKNGVLHIYSEGNINTSKGMKAYVTARELNSLSISGGVKISSGSTFQANTFKLDLSGGSKVTLALDVNKLDAEMSGASKVELTGRADEVLMDLSGASNITAENLAAKRVKIGASGASKVRVSASEELDINASGASNVQYKGSPKITSDVSAAARISRL